MTTETNPSPVACPCGSTSWTVGETSFVYQRCVIDTADPEPYPDNYDSGDIEETYTRSADFAECAECGTEPDDATRAALIGYWCGTEPQYPEMVAAILTAADELMAAIAARGWSAVADEPGRLTDALAPMRRARDRANEAAAQVGAPQYGNGTLGALVPG